MIFGAFLIIPPYPIIQLLGILTVMSTAVYALAGDVKKNSFNKKNTDRAYAKKIKLEQKQKRRTQKITLEFNSKQNVNKKTKDYFKVRQLKKEQAKKEQLSNKENEIFFKEVENYLKKHDKLRHNKTIEKKQAEEEKNIIQEAEKLLGD